MRFRVFVSRLPGGALQATCLDPQCNARGDTNEEAVERIRQEIVYRLEYCPCSSLRANETVEVEVVCQPGAC